MNRFGRPLSVASVLMVAMVLGRLGAQPAAQDALSNRYENGRVGATLTERILTTGNVGPIAALPQVEELNIGHSIVSRAVLIGMEAAVREMIEAMTAAAAERAATVFLQ